MDSNLISLIVLALIVAMFVADMLRNKRSRPKNEAVPQKEHPSTTAKVATKSERELTQAAPASVEITQTADDAPVSEPEQAAVEPAVESAPATVSEPVTEAVISAEPEATEEEVSTSFFGRIKAGLTRTRSQLSDGLSELFLGKKEIDDELFEEIETLLLTADIGIEATTLIIENITEKSSRNELKDSASVHQLLKEELASLLDGHQAPLDIDAGKAPFVILVVGVNGVGKTTTIGKMAKRFQSQGHSVMLAAGDTFRAAAVEQLQVWGERNDVPVVAQHTGADSASVIFDAVESAKSKGVDIVIADTAGRLQNKDNLMTELEKVVRVMQKIDPSAPHEVMLVLDAGTGQNALNQAKVFQEAVGVSGISLTKLDGTAKGGIIFAIAKQLALPIRFIGVGEQIDDLRPFEAKEFVSALFDE